MPSLLKYGDDHLHFLTWTCYHRQRWLGEPKRRDLFLHTLEEARRHYRFMVVGYAAMPSTFICSSANRRKALLQR